VPIWAGGLPRVEVVGITDVVGVIPDSRDRLGEASCGCSEGTQHGSSHSDRRIRSRRLDGVHDEYGRCHRTGHNANAVDDFNGRDSGTDHHGELDRDHARGSQ
jgi:hypothetical protein